MPPRNARDLARAPQSYSPVSYGPAPESPQSVSQSPSGTAAPPQFEIHSELDAVRHEFSEDNFDLRSASTQREPLAGRQPMPSTDWTTVHEPASARRESSVPSERGLRRDPSSSSAMTILVDRGQKPGDKTRDSIPSVPPVAAQARGVPVSWVLGAAAFAVLLALIAAWVVRAPSARDAARPSEERTRAEERAAPTAALPTAQSALSSASVVRQGADNRGGSGTAGPAGTNLAAKALPTASAVRPADTSASNAPNNARPLAPASAHAFDLHVPTPNATEAGAKPRQSIY
jgi:hypothetical protein